MTKRRGDTPPSTERVIALARRHFSNCELVGEEIPIVRERPATLRGLIDVVDSPGWAFLAWDSRARLLGMVEVRPGNSDVVRAVADYPWVGHALHLALAQGFLPDMWRVYVLEFEIPGISTNRAVEVSFYDNEVVIPIEEEPRVMTGQDFAAKLYDLLQQA